MKPSALGCTGGGRSCAGPISPRQLVTQGSELLHRAGRVEISAQNHNYAVDPADLDGDVEVTHINLNDGTCAGLLCSARKAMSIQYHPEASPGPHDGDVSFKQYVDMMAAERSQSSVPMMGV